MKILHVLNDSLPTLCGYTIRSANIFRVQSALGMEPLAVTSPHHEPPFTLDVEVVESVRHYRTTPVPGRRVPFLHELSAVRRMVSRIDEVVRAERPDVLHAHSPCLWGEAALRVARRRQLPFVYEIRGFWEDAAVDLGKTREGSLRYRLSRAWETRVARRADVLATIAEHLKGDLVGRKIPADRIVLVPNGVDTQTFRPAPPDQRLLDSLDLNGRVRIGYIGTLYPWEGVEDLVRAVPHVVRRAPQARFLIIGAGQQADAIRELIARLGVGDHVHFIGKVRHEDIVSYYSILDLLVYPRRSTRNTELVTPLKPLEAMAMEKAVLGSDVGGVRELLAEGTGLLHGAGDPVDLAEKCLALIVDGKQRIALGKRARAHVEATRNWNIVGQRYSEIYSRSIGICRRRLGQPAGPQDREPPGAAVGHRAAT